jgi:hypothetical protein
MLSKCVCLRAAMRVTPRRQAVLIEIVVAAWQSDSDAAQTRAPDTRPAEIE